MPKHNNAIPNVHFRKDWQRFVKTWFDQPAKKSARRQTRLAKAKRLAPRPLNMLRPVVHGQTVRYNMKLRLGRGFSLDELESAGINRKEALGLGISVDWRRRNKSVEDFERNVNRLKAYKDKLVVFPRKGKKAKNGDSSSELLAIATQNSDRVILPLQKNAAVTEIRSITDAEKETNVFGTLRNERTIAKLWAIREKRLKEKDTEKAAKKSKK